MMKTSKKVLSLLLTVVMAFGCVGLLSGVIGSDPFGTKQTAQAAGLTSQAQGNYTFAVYFKRDGGSLDNKTAQWGTSQNDNCCIAIRYRGDNGYASSTSTTADYWNGERGYDWHYTGTVSGFPDGVFGHINEDNIARNAKLFIHGFKVNGIQVWSGMKDMISSTDDHYAYWYAKYYPSGSAMGTWSNNCNDGDTNDTNIWWQPHPTSTFTGETSVSTSGSTQKTYGVTKVVDQYGTNWGFNSIQWVSSHPAATINNSGVATFGHNGGIDYDVTFTPKYVSNSATVASDNGITVHVTTSINITYNLNGGTVSGNPTSYNINTAPVLLNNPTKTGYTFTGWTGSNGAVPQTEVYVPNGVSSGLSFSTSNPYTASGRDHILGNAFTVLPGMVYRVFVTAKRTAGSLNLQGGIWYTSQTNGASYDGYGGAFTYWRDAGNGWGIYYKDVTVPNNKQAGKFYIQLDQFSPYGTTWQIANCCVTSAFESLPIGAERYTTSNPYTCNIRDHIIGSGVSVTVGQTYRVYCTAKRTSGSLPFNGGLWYYDNTSGSPWDGVGGAFTLESDLGNGWGRYYKDVTVPSGKIHANAYIQIEQSHSGVEGNVWQIADLAVVHSQRSELSYIANWTPTPYTITYNVDGGTAISALNYNIESTNTLPTPVKTGYTFGGWKPTSTVGNWNANNTYAAGTSVTGKYGSVTLKAQWTINSHKLDVNGYLYTVAKDSGDNDGGLGNKAKATVYVDNAVHSSGNNVNDFYSDVTYNKSYKIVVTPIAGWKMAGINSITSGVTYSMDSNTDANLTVSGTMPDKAVSYRFAMRPKVIKLTLNNQSATTAGTGAVYYKFEQSAAQDTSNTSSTGTYFTSGNNTNNTVTGVISAITKPTKTGYTFGGYYTAANGGGTQYIDANGNFVNNAYSTVTADTTLYAKWTVNKYVFDVNGWIEDRVDPDDPIGNLVGDLNGVGSFDLYLNGELQNGGHSIDAGDRINFGTTYSVSNIQAEEGWHYVGPYSGSFTVGDWFSGNTTTSLSGTVGTDGVFIVLQFDKNRSNLKVDPNGGSWETGTAVQTIEGKYQEEKSISDPTPPEGMVFIGWTFSGANGSFSNGVYTYGATENALDTLTAQYAQVAVNDTFVLDFGLGAELDVLSNDIPDATLKTDGISGVSAGFTAEVNNGKIAFIPQSLMTGTSTFTYTVTYGGKDYTASVTVIPAASVYYEESFVTFNNGAEASWTAETNYDGIFQNAARPGDENSPVYGFDSAYDKANSSNYSLDKVRSVEVTKKTDPSAATDPTATFTFTGTGFDVYAVTSNETGVVIVEVKKGETLVKNMLINTYFGYSYGPLFLNGDTVTLTNTGVPLYFLPESATDGYFLQGGRRGTTDESKSDKTGQAVGWVSGEGSSALYQVPVICLTGLDYGTYTVKIRPRFSATQDMTHTGKYKFILDAVRIYDPINPANIAVDSEIHDAYVADSEYKTTYQELRAILLSKTSFDEGTAAQTETGSAEKVGVAFLESRGGKENSIATYKDIGPKNEVYLEKGQAIAFNIATASTVIPAKLSVGVKMAQGGSGSVLVKCGGSETTLNVSGSTELYREINVVTWNGTGTQYKTAGPVVIKNNSNNNVVVSLTKLKWSYDSRIDGNTTNSSSGPSFVKSRRDAPARTQDDANRMLTFSFSADALNTLNLTEQTAATNNGPTLSSDGVTVVWDKDTFELGETATLTVTAPANFEKAFVDGKEIVGFEENGDGTRTWTYTVTAEELGLIPADVTVEDANGYRTAAIAAPKLTATAPTVDVTAVITAWNTETLTRGETAALTVTVPAKVVKVTVGGETLTQFTLLEDGRRQFDCTVTPENAGAYQYTVTLEEVHGYSFDAGLTPVLTVNPAPAASETDPAEGEDGNTGTGNAAGRRSFCDLIRAILNFFRKVINMFKIKTV